QQTVTPARHHAGWPAASSLAPGRWTESSRPSRRKAITGSPWACSGNPPRSPLPAWTFSSSAACSRPANVVSSGGLVLPWQQRNFCWSVVRSQKQEPWSREALGLSFDGQRTMDDGQFKGGSHHVSPNPSEEQ